MPNIETLPPVDLGPYDPRPRPKLLRRVVHVDDTRMRAMRLWHWQHACAATKRQNDPRSTPASRAIARQTWAFHMGCVQALNDLFPMGDTAEKDATHLPAFPQMLPHRVPA